jgi:hypothetical protein
LFVGLTPPFGLTYCRAVSVYNKIRIGVVHSHDLQSLVQEAREWLLSYKGIASVKANLSERIEGKRRERKRQMRDGQSGCQSGGV